MVSHMCGMDHLQQARKAPEKLDINHEIRGSVINLRRWNKDLGKTICGGPESFRREFERLCDVYDEGTCNVAFGIASKRRSLRFITVKEEVYDERSEASMLHKRINMPMSQGRVNEEAQEMRKARFK